MLYLDFVVLVGDGVPAQHAGRSVAGQPRACRQDAKLTSAIIAGVFRATRRRLLISAALGNITAHVTAMPPLGCRRLNYRRRDRHEGFIDHGALLARNVIAAYDFQFEACFLAKCLGRPQAASLHDTPSRAFQRAFEAPMTPPRASRRPPPASSSRCASSPPASDKDRVSLGTTIKMVYFDDAEGAALNAIGHRREGHRQSTSRPATGRCSRISRLPRRRV